MDFTANWWLGAHPEDKWEVSGYKAEVGGASTGIRNPGHVPLSLKPLRRREVKGQGRGARMRRRPEAGRALGA